jgi:serine/threonine protein kinase
MVAGFLKYYYTTNVQLFDKILHAQFTYPSWFSTNIRGILELMMVRDPKTRIGLSQLRELPYIKSLEATSNSNNSSSNSSSATSAAVVVDGSHAHGLDEANHISDDGLDLNHDDWDSDTQTLKTLNAFDLLTQCGGFCLDRLFSPQLYATIKDGPIADSMSDQIGGNLRFGGPSFTQQAITSKFNIASTLPDARELIALAHSSLIALGCECVQSVETCVRTGALRANKMTSKGMIVIGVRVFNVSAQMSLLEVRRGKGSLFEWCLLFNNLVDDKLKGVLLRPTEGEAKDT